jgi:hypothetical protein
MSKWSKVGACSCALAIAFAGFVAACSSSSSAGGGSSTSDSGVTSSGNDVDAAVGDAGNADTWASYAQGFFATYCVSCHDSKDSTGRDFTMQAKVESEKTTIRCGVAVTQDPSWKCAASPVAKQFPIGGGPKPSDAERDRIVAWITAGAP